MYFLSIRALTLSANILKFCKKLLTFALRQERRWYRIGEGAIFSLQLSGPQSLSGPSSTPSPFAIFDLNLFNFELIKGCYRPGSTEGPDSSLSHGPERVDNTSQFEDGALIQCNDYGLSWLRSFSPLSICFAPFQVKMLFHTWFPFGACYHYRRIITGDCFYGKRLKFWQFTANG